MLFAVVVLATMAQRLRVAYPIVLVLGGLAISFVPGVPPIALPPDLVLVIFLPPLLYWESLNVSYRDLRASIRPILNLAIGLVLATIAAVTLVAHAILPFSWAMAIVLGSIVGPTDEVAASAIARYLPLPSPVVSIIEDESLLNDASSLVIYRVAVAAVVTGSFSLVIGGLQVVEAGLGGIAIGLAVGWGIAQFRRFIDSPLIANTVSLLTGFVAYLPADALGLSGVLSVAACGIYLSRIRPRTLTPQMRLQNVDIWEMVDFLLNSVLFILIGLQLHGILGSLARYQQTTLVLGAIAVILTVVVLRILWVFAGAYLPRLLIRSRREQPGPPWQSLAIVSWTGMRGGVSLAAALAVPFVAQGHPLANRDLIIFITYAVILATLVGQGLTLPYLIRRLGVREDIRERREELVARAAATQAGLQRLNSLTADGASAKVIEDLRRHLLAKQRLLGESEEEDKSLAARQRLEANNRVRREVVDAERDAVIDLRDQGIINDDVMRKIEHELDLEETRLDG